MALSDQHAVTYDFEELQPVIGGVRLDINITGTAERMQRAAREIFAEFEDIEPEALSGGGALPDIENYPDSRVAGAWAWMSDVEDGKGALDPKTMQLIGLRRRLADTLRILHPLPPQGGSLARRDRSGNRRSRSNGRLCPQLVGLPLWHRRGLSDRTG